MATDNERALGMLQTALEMEEKGFAFYEKAVGETGNELGRNIFTMLKEDELVHVERIKTIYAEISGGGGWNDEWKTVAAPQRDLGQMFRDMAYKHRGTIQPQTSDLDALQVGIDFEARAVAFYKEHLADAADELEIEFIKEMIAEEETHHELLTDMKLYLSDPDAWFREKERSHVDGA
ncbi:MAG: ferritin family protein [Candidatus Lernaella stagnicola]|nr:ferritin family protein [Candidatus Lernaella stagnicola]